MFPFCVSSWNFIHRKEKLERKKVFLEFRVDNLSYQEIQEKKDDIKQYQQPK